MIKLGSMCYCTAEQLTWSMRYSKLARYRLIRPTVLGEIKNTHVGPGRQIMYAYAGLIWSRAIGGLALIASCVRWVEEVFVCDMLAMRCLANLHAWAWEGECLA